MNRPHLLCLIIISVFFTSAASAQYTNKDNDESGAPAGMEVRKVNNDVSVLVPKGARMYKSNSTTYVEESADEYAARNAAEMKVRLKKLEMENRALADEINYLRSQLPVAPQKNVSEDVQTPAEE
ncbi:MAG: hypothetical protein WCY36_05185 [Candidatus Omnitrophota bacterium]